MASAPRRGLEPGMVCIKNLILGMSCLFMMTGMLLIAVGSTIKGVYSNFDALLGSDFISPATFLITVGAIVFFVSLFGCVGALRESTCLINLYTVSLIIIFIFEISAGLAGFVMHTSVRNTLIVNFKDSIQNSYLTDDNVLAAIDTVQSQLRCCGSESPEDWEGVLSSSNSNLTENDIIVPDSCCGSFNTTLTGSSDCFEPFTDGCLDRLVRIAQQGASLLTAVAITIALIQAMGVYFSNELALAIRRAKSNRALRQMEIRNQLVSTYQPMGKQTPSPSPTVYLAGVAEDTAA